MMREVVRALKVTLQEESQDVCERADLKCEEVSPTHTSGTLKVLHHLSRCFAVDAAVYDFVGSNHTKLLKSSIMTKIYLT